MRFEWLAAMAYPRAIAVHPNFRSTNVPKPAAALASLLLEENEPDLPNDGSADFVLLELCQSVLLNGDEIAVENLRAFANDASHDLGQRSAAALMSTAIQMAESVADRGNLDALIVETGASPDPLVQVAHFWLRLASATIDIRYGLERRDELHSIRQGLLAVSTIQSEGFETSEGLQLASATVVQRIVEVLAHAALGWQSFQERFTGDLWMERLRTPEPYLRGNINGMLASGYDGWIRRSYEHTFRPSTIHLGGSTLPGDSSMSTALLVSEFTFHPDVQSIALQVGRARMLRSREISDDSTARWAVESALQLMRLGGNKETLVSAARHVIRHGPLEALIADANVVVRGAMRRGWPTVLELHYLAEAAPVLGVGSSVEVLDSLATEVQGGESPPEPWTPQWARTEAILHCIGALAGPAASARRAIGLLAAAVSPDGGELHDRALAVGVNRLPADSDTNDDLIILLEALGSNSTFATTRQTIASRIGETKVAEYLGPAERVSDFEAAVSYIDAVMRLQRSANVDESASFAKTLRGVLEAERRQASTGVQTLGGTPALDVMAAFALSAGMDELWPEIVDGLGDANLSRSEKTSALQRISRRSDQLPTGIADRLRERFPAIMATPASHLEPEVHPYPAGVQLACALELVPAEQLVALAAPLLYSSSSAVRADGISMLAVFPSSLRPEWVAQAALMASYDEDENVQAEAVSMMALIYPTSDQETQAFFLTRINDLLDSDGTWTLRKLLAVLALDQSREVRDALSTRIASLSRHVDWRVREAAGRLRS